MPASPEKLPLASMDVAADKQRLLLQLFPEVFTETADGNGGDRLALDFEKLKAVLGEHGALAEPGQERYGLEWPGKRDALRAVQAPSYGTLIPAPEESVDWENTQNVFIEGDNLEVLKLLQKSYYGKVKMIYIDPPYNTGNDFVYPDNYAESLDTYLRYTGQIDDQGFKTTTNSKESGRFHSNWLRMMYPRLYVAKNLLREDGILLIHIDEHERSALQLLLLELFGEENFLGEIIWDKANPKGDSTKISIQHESLLLFAKSYEAFKQEGHELKRPKANASRMLRKAQSLLKKKGSVSVPDDLASVIDKYGLDVDASPFEQEWTLDSIGEEFRSWIKGQDLSGGEAAYRFIDADGEVFRPVSMAWPNKKKAPDDYFIPLKHPISGKNCPVPDRGWRNPPETMANLLARDLILFGPDETKQPERKYLLKENLDENIPSVVKYGGSDDELLKSLAVPFENPKPVGLAKSFLEWFTDDGDLVVDFFAGSGTCAHACALAENNPRYLAIQLPEVISDGEFATIAELAKERIRRAGAKIREELRAKATKTAGELALDALTTLSRSDAPDTGFRVFKLAPSNFRRWDGEAAAVSKEALEQQLEASLDHIATGATEESILFEILLKAGYELTCPMEKLELAGQTVYAVDGSSLYVSVADRIDSALIDAVAEKHPVQFICLDRALQGNDSLKVNTLETFRACQPEIQFRTV